MSYWLAGNIVLVKKMSSLKFEGCCIMLNANYLERRKALSFEGHKLTVVLCSCGLYLHGSWLLVHLFLLQFYQLSLMILILDVKLLILYSFFFFLFFWVFLVYSSCSLVERGVWHHNSSIASLLTNQSIYVGIQLQTNKLCKQV